MLSLYTISNVNIFTVSNVFDTEIAQLVDNDHGRQSPCILCTATTDELAKGWRHQMESFSSLLALCTENSPTTGEFPTQKPVTRGFDVFVCSWINGWVNNGEAGGLRHHLTHYDVTVMDTRRHDTNRQVIHPVQPVYSCLSTWKVGSCMRCWIINPLHVLNYSGHRWIPSRGVRNAELWSILCCQQNKESKCHGTLKSFQFGVKVHADVNSWNSFSDPFKTNKRFAS